MISAAPTVLAVEIDSAWVVILAVSAVTLLAAIALRRLIGRPGGIASGLLMLTPLVLPLIAAVIFEQALLPELAVLKPVGQALLERSRGLLHLVMLPQSGGEAVTPYALSGSAGPWLLLVGASVSSFMLLRRALGTLLLARLVRRCRPLDSQTDCDLLADVARLSSLAGLSRRPRVLVLPAGVSGAFALGFRRLHILLSEDLLAELDDEELEGILAHEIAHLAARDVPLVFMAGLLRDLVAWNPFAHSAFRRLAASREGEADRQAAALTGRPLAVASGLLRVCELVRSAGGSRRHRMALAAISPHGRLSGRIGALLAMADGRSSPLPAAGLPYIAAACVVALLGLQAGSQIAQSGASALAIVWGAEDEVAARIWAPGDGVSGRPVGVPRRPALKKGLDRRYPGFAEHVLVRTEDVPAWLERMTRWTRRTASAKSGLSPATFRWEGRQTWQVIRLSPELGPIQIYRLELPNF